MKNAFFIFGAVLLVACGAKDNVSTEGDAPVIGGGRQGQVENPITSGPPSTGSLVQIACESSIDFGVTFPNSLMTSGAKVFDSITRASESANQAPTILNVDGNILSSLFVSGGKIYFARYDLLLHQLVDEPQVVGRAGGRSSGVYRALGFSQPRVAAASPDGRAFVMNNKGSLEVHSSADPERALLSWKVRGDYVQPRWEGEEIFLDRTDGGKLRQTVITVDKNFNQLSVNYAPAALAGDLDQIGLRRFSASTYIWLERNSRRAVLRVWNHELNAVKNYELPNGKMYGPGFALLRSEAGKLARAVLNSAEGVHYFTLGADGALSGEAYAYPEETQNVIRNASSDNPWYSGAVYSAAGDTQLFLILPGKNGMTLLSAVDEGLIYRGLGFDSCRNPDFYRVGK